MGTDAQVSTWLESQLPLANNVRFEGLGRTEVGHSAETLLGTIGWSDDRGDQQQEVVLRIRPPAPGLLEPYDLPLEFEILSRLEETAVRAPRALWLESSGQVLGREFYIMERLPGVVYENGVPPELASDPDLARRMCESMVEQLAAIHAVDLQQTGLNALGDGRGYLDSQLNFWSDEVRRVQQGPLPALERLIAALQQHKPEQCSNVTLVHGDPKAGNFAFENGDVSAVFDWEMATIGDPLADIGWAEVLWTTPGTVTTVPGALSTEEFVALWEKFTGIQTQHRPWYRALQIFKMVTIQLIGSALVEVGLSNDQRLLDMSYAIRPFTELALKELGIDEPIPSGPVLPRKERRLEMQQLKAP
jgi:aminoglycoside phosphotransferase (APT) family kinase protein